MGERYNGIVEVRGSIPRGSTNQSARSVDLALHAVKGLGRIRPDPSFFRGRDSAPLFHELDQGRLRRRMA
jgi:hypothetical protein